MFENDAATQGCHGGPRQQPTAASFSHEPVKKRGFAPREAPRTKWRSYRVPETVNRGGFVPVDCQFCHWLSIPLAKVQSVLALATSGTGTALPRADTVAQLVHLPRLVPRPQGRKSKI